MAECMLHADVLAANNAAHTEAREQAALERSELISTHASAIEALVVAHTTALTELTASHGVSMQESASSHAAAIEELTAEHAAAVAVMVTEHTTRVTDLERECTMLEGTIQQSGAAHKALAELKEFKLKTKCVACLLWLLFSNLVFNCEFDSLGYFSPINTFTCNKNKQRTE